MASRQRSMWGLAALLLVLAGVLTLTYGRIGTAQWDTAKITPTTPSLDIEQVAGSDTTFTLPGDVRYYAIKSRDALDWRIAFASGDIAAGDYKTIPGTSEYYMENIDPGKGAQYIIYLRGDTGSADTLEIELWKGK